MHKVWLEHCAPSNMKPILALDSIA